MGYTHYWKINKAIPDDKWKQITNHFTRQIQPKYHEIIQREFNDSRSPVCDDESIIFNGIEDDGHETLCVSKKVTSFEFCKTARKPYDAAVVATLKIVKHYAPDCIELSSDGDEPEKKIFD